MAEAPAVERWSPVDALRLVVAAASLLVVLLVDWLVGEEVVDFFGDVLAGFASIDADVVTAVAVVARIGGLVLLGVGFVVATRHGAWRFLVTVAAAAALSAALLVLVDGLLDAETGPVLASDDLLGALGERGFPTAAGLAAVTGVVAAGVPWLARRWRRLGWLLVIVLAAVRMLTAPLGFDTLAALFCGALAGALADAAFGVPTRRPTHAAVRAGLARSGVGLAELTPASVDARGSTPYFATTTDGGRLFVKALGTDERKADLLFRLVRSATRRDLGDERPFSSLRRAVEHEALVALAAANLGVRTPRVTAFAAAEPGAFVLAYEAVDGRSLDGVGEAELTDVVLDGIWGQLQVLRSHAIAHRDLRLANVFLAADGAVWLIDFGFSELAATDLLLRTDLAELVLALSLKVGPERAVGRAQAGVGAAALVDALPRFQPAYLSGATRTALKEQPDLLPTVRALVGQGVP